VVAFISWGAAGNGEFRSLAWALRPRSAIALGDQVNPPLPPRWPSVARFGSALPGRHFWKMQAGMGDAVIAPLYLRLKKRGYPSSSFTG
jgi:hypothetical protein